MMDGYNGLEQAKEFVRKTLVLVEQYDSFSLSKDRFEITMRVNCLLGLVIVPQQHLPQEQKELLITKDTETEWGMNVENISYGVYRTGKCGFKNNAHTIARHMRNSLCHKNRFVIKSGNGVDITHVHFSDFKSEDNLDSGKTFDYEMNVADLTRFVINYANNFLR